MVPMPMEQPCKCWLMVGNGQKAPLYVIRYGSVMMLTDDQRTTQSAVRMGFRTSDAHALAEAILKLADGKDKGNIGELLAPSMGLDDAGRISGVGSYWRVTPKEVSKSEVMAMLADDEEYEPDDDEDSVDNDLELSDCDQKQWSLEDFA